MRPRCSSRQITVRSARCVISQVSPGHKNRLWFSLDGADASRVLRPAGARVRCGSAAGNRDRRRTPRARGRAYSVLPAGHPQGYQDSFTAFVGDMYAAIAGRVPDGLPTFADGVRAAVLTGAVLRSAAAGEWVDVAVSAETGVTA